MLLESLSAYGARDAIAPLADEVLHHAKRAVLDWLSALYPGTRLSPCRELLAAHNEELGHGRCSLPGNGTTAFPATAAWINGSASHTAEFDDIFRDAVYHPGCPVIAAALALAEHRRGTGRALLNAIVVGYEISTRIGAALQPSHYRYFHTTGTVGSLGAAAAAAALAAPGDADAMGHAIATSATMAAGLQQAFRSDAMSKALHAGHAAAVGVRAGQAAAHGVTGVPDILEGKVGFGAALAQDPAWDAVLEGLGDRYNITRVTQKNHGCCGHTFAAIDAALALRETGVRAQDIASIHVATYRAALDVAGNPEPASAFEAKFSLPYTVAYAMRHGSVRLAAFLPEALQDADTRALMRRVRLAEDTALTAGFPSMRAARVTIVTHDGARHEHFAPYRKGDPEAPLSDKELNDKFDELAAPVLGSERARQLRRSVWALESLDVRDLDLAADQPTHDARS
ncbi:MmgE/PrpD family protein [Bordetella genomosp. 9]|uniref:2-methylcitrate dehydratase n=1 Tax=Bordetella genomosp. 9 TaxID=1416803 RepID=A0A1W6Z4Z2_9BORD|nr:MmgE/PrpD family protein [Bordetella genomosp. 9]ARP88418.1 2-methylcitrate dehydratase [Bordetella genomosp. 9]